jgi:hypothetical protein
VGILAYDHEGRELWSIRSALPENTNGSGTSPVAGDDVLLSRDDPLRHTFSQLMARRGGRYGKKATASLASAGYQQHFNSSSCR